MISIHRFGTVPSVPSSSAQYLLFLQAWCAHVRGLRGAPVIKAARGATTTAGNGVIVKVTPSSSSDVLLLPQDLPP